MAVTVGSNLTPIRPHAFLRQLMKKAGQHGQRQLRSVSTVKFFTKEGIPATDTEEDSPGSDICFIWDISNDDVYLVHTWTAADSFTSVKIID